MAWLRRDKVRLRHDVALAESGLIKLSEVRYKTNHSMYYVYSLKCKDGYYIGCTDDLKSRLKRHKLGQVPATTNRLPVKLELYITFSDKYIAYNFEKYLKSGSGRAFVKKHFELKAGKA